MTASPATVLRLLAPIALVAGLATACGDNDKSAGKTTAPPPPNTSTTLTGGPITAKKNRLFIGKRDLYPLLGKSLKRYAPTQVNGYSTRVVALAGPASFWAGRSPSQRLLVKLRLKGGKAPKIRRGQKVDFVGQLLESKDASGLGVTDAAGKRVLATQGVYVDASAADVKFR